MESQNDNIINKLQTNMKNSRIIIMIYIGGGAGNTLYWIIPYPYLYIEHIYGGSAAKLDYKLVIRLNHKPQSVSHDTHTHTRFSHQNVAAL